MNIWILILQAGPVAKLTMVILFLISLGAWTIIFFKWREFSRNEQTLQDLVDTIEEAGDCISLVSKLKSFRKTPGWRVVRALLNEWVRFRAEKVTPSAPVSEAFLRRLSKLVPLCIERELLLLRQGLTYLAVAGNSSPFIGLFGTVWGIMSAFHDIGLKGSASLATVAPGIAEALIATALGLFAAIPAAMAYNFFTARLERLEVYLQEVGTLTLMLVDKELHHLSSSNVEVKDEV